MNDLKDPLTLYTYIGYCLRSIVNKLTLKNFDKGDVHHDVFLKLVGKEIISKKYTYQVAYFAVLNTLRNPKNVPLDDLLVHPSYTPVYETVEDSGEYERWVKGLRPVRQTVTTYPVSIELVDGETIHYDSLIQASDDIGVGRVALWEWLNGGTLPKKIKTVWKADFVTSDLKIRRKISRHRFDSDDRWQKEFEYNEDKGSCYNEWKTILVHKTMPNEAIMISEVYPSRFSGRKDGKI